MSDLKLNPTRQHGRKSLDKQSAQAFDKDDLRPDPPDEFELSNAETKEWWAVANRMPPDWFQRETFPLLAQYARATVRSHTVSKLVKQMEAQREYDIKDYKSLLQLENQLSATIARLSTKMRIAQQSTFDKSRRPGKVVKNPWED